MRNSQADDSLNARAILKLVEFSRSLVEVGSVGDRLLDDAEALARRVDQPRGTKKEAATE